MREAGGGRRESSARVGRVYAVSLQEAGGRAALLVKQSEQQVLTAEVVVSQVDRCFQGIRMDDIRLDDSDSAAARPASSVARDPVVCPKPSSRLVSTITTPSAVWATI